MLIQRIKCRYCPYEAWVNREVDINCPECGMDGICVLETRSREPSDDVNKYSIDYTSE